LRIGEALVESRPLPQLARAAMHQAYWMLVRGTELERGLVEVGDGIRAVE